MDKFIDNVEVAIILILILLAVSSFIAGIITEMTHCFLVSMMALVVVCVQFIDHKKTNK